MEFVSEGHSSSLKEDITNVLLYSEDNFARLFFKIQLLYQPAWYSLRLTTKRRYLTYFKL